MYFENSAVYEVMWKKYGGTKHVTDEKWRMYISFRITKATNAHSEYIILIGFLRQQ